MSDGLVPSPGPGARRRSVRRRLPGGAQGDVVGVVLDDTSEALTLLPEDAPPVVVPHAEVLAGRDVPARVVRPSSSPADVERLAAEHWPGLETARLGGWLLRAGAGWTSRANSALVVGDPGRPAGEALGIVEDFYACRGLTPRVQVPLREPGRRGEGGRPGGDATVLTPVLDDLGWGPPQDETLVLVAGLDDVAAGEPATPVEATWAGAPGADWLALHRGGSSATQPAARRVLSAAPARYLRLHRGGETLAIARVAVGRGWAGLSCLEVRPDARRRGLGRHASLVALAHARGAGARFAYLQVTTQNGEAQALYADLRFAVHHRYHYRVAAGH